jgi:hypothetical protein
MKKLPYILASALAIGSAQAAVVVTDNGTTVPTIGANDTGFTGTTNQRFGWDTETFTQSFTASNSGTIGTIYLGYNAFDNGDTLTMTLSVNGDVVQSGLVLDGNNFSGNAATDNNAGQFYWMRFDLSAENVAVTAGSNNFTMTATGFTGVSWALALRYNSVTTSYTGGALTGLSNTGDLAFVVTVVPEPSIALLGGLGLLGLLLRRRA